MTILERRWRNFEIIVFYGKQNYNYLCAQSAAGKELFKSSFMATTFNFAKCARQKIDRIFLPRWPPTIKHQNLQHYLLVVNFNHHEILKYMNFEVGQQTGLLMRALKFPRPQERNIFKMMITPQ